MYAPTITAKNLALTTKAVLLIDFSNIVGVEMDTNEEGVSVTLYPKNGEGYTLPSLVSPEVGGEIRRAFVNHFGHSETVFVFPGGAFFLGAFEAVSVAPGEYEGEEDFLVVSLKTCRDVLDIPRYVEGRDLAKELLVKLGYMSGE